MSKTYEVCGISDNHSVSLFICKKCNNSITICEDCYGENACPKCSIVDEEEDYFSLIMDEIDR